MFLPCLLAKDLGDLRQVIGQTIATGLALWQNNGPNRMNPIRLDIMSLWKRETFPHKKPLIILMRNHLPYSHHTPILVFFHQKKSCLLQVLSIRLKLRMTCQRSSLRVGPWGKGGGSDTRITRSCHFELLFQIVKLYIHKNHPPKKSPPNRWYMFLTKVTKVQPPPSTLLLKLPRCPPSPPVVINPPDSKHSSVVNPARRGCWACQSHPHLPPEAESNSSRLPTWKVHWGKPSCWRSSWESFLWLKLGVEVDDMMIWQTKQRSKLCEVTWN